MQNPPPYISQSGEITDRASLISEIESLLNAIPSQSRTILSPAVMDALSLKELESMRDSLLTRDSLTHNREWLLGLVSC